MNQEWKKLIDRYAWKNWILQFDTPGATFRNFHSFDHTSMDKIQDELTKVELYKKDLTTMRDGLKTRFKEIQPGKHDSWSENSSLSPCL